MEEKYEKVFRGPIITWNKDDVKAMVEEFGKEGAIERLAGDNLTIDYVRMSVENMLQGSYEKEFETATLIGFGDFGEIK